jgi:membrane-bound lytic murein transglycosylase B
VPTEGAGGAPHWSVVRPRPTRAVPRLLVVTLTALALLLGWSPALVAGEPADPPPVPDPRIAPELAAVPVDSPAYRAAVGRYRAAESRLHDARLRFDVAQRELTELHEADARLAGEINESARRHDKAQARLDELRDGLRELAVANYVHSGAGQGPAASFDLEGIVERRRHRVVVDTVNSSQLQAVAFHAEQVRSAGANRDRAVGDLAEVRQRLSDRSEQREQALADGWAATDDLGRFTAEVADARLEAEVVGLDFTFVVLDAYVKASIGIELLRPGCGLPWPVLAGIGRTESRHGTFGGATVQADGQVSKPIIGIPLDGNNDTAVIADSDGGALDGDPVWDRAVGPMQFIPTTWRALGLDGNGDGEIDPHNIYDAALSAANLLCRAGPLEAEGPMRSAVLRYNNSRAYVDTVLGHARRYEEFVIPPLP